MLSFKEWLELNEGKKDACYHKVKSRYRVWPSAYACVPKESSKALTRTGWKRFEELSIGEEILTFSLEKNLLEFKPILNLHSYKNAETYVVRNGNTGWKFECTPNHKWVIKYPKCSGKRGRKKHETINDMGLVTLEDLLKGSGSNRKLVISAKYQDGEPASLNKIYKYQTNWIEYLLSCSPEQRESWLYSAIVYDGNQIKTHRMTALQKNQELHEYKYDTPYGKQSFGFKQKDENHRDAFLLSAFLNKGLVTFKKSKNRNIYSCHYVAYDGTKSWENFKLCEKREADVWCPETENGTWVMMQETDGHGIITITGNSGALVKCRKVGASNWGNSKNESTQCSFCTDKAASVELWDEEVPVCDACSAEISEGTFDLEKKRGLKGWFDRNQGKGWIDCKKSSKGNLVPCGRKTAGKGAERSYPACRPTLSACTSKGVKSKKSNKSVDWK